MSKRKDDPADRAYSDFVIVTSDCPKDGAEAEAKHYGTTAVKTENGWEVVRPDGRRVIYVKR